jgi:hypothetical protein
VKERRFLAAALGLSLLLHAALLVWAARQPESRPTVTAVLGDANDARWIEVEPDAHPSRPALWPPTNTVGGTTSAPHRPHATPRVSQPESSGSQASDSPLATSPRLLPFEDVLGPVASATPHGHLVVNDGTDDRARRDPCEDAAEAEARVQGFAEDMVADARVKSGQFDPNLSGLGATLEAQLDNGDLSLRGNPLQDLTRAWLAAAQQDARTGSPHAEGSRAEGHAEVGTLRALADGTYGLGLIALLDIRLGPGGRPVTTALVGPSGNRAFDRYVVDQAPVAISLLPTAMDGGTDMHPEGTHSVWQFEGKMKYSKKLQLHELRVRDVASLAGHALLSTVTNGYVAPTGRFDEQSGSVEVVDLADPHFSCRVKLLRLY